MAKKKAEKSPQRVITLGARAYDRLERLVSWVEVVPAGIDIGENGWDDVQTQMNGFLADHLGPEETAWVQIGRDTLIALIDDGQGIVRRVPVLPTNVTARIARGRWK